MHCFLAHSHFSFLQASSSPSELLEAAVASGVTSLALTDFDGVYGAPAFHRAAKLIGGIKIVHGTELLVKIPGEEGLVPHQLSPRTVVREENTTDTRAKITQFQERIAFIARNKFEWSEICSLVTYVHRDGKKALPLELDDPHIPWPQSAVVVIPQRGVAAIVFTKSPWGVARQHMVSTLAQRFPQRCYLAVMPCTSPFQKQALEHQLAAHRHCGIPLLATPDVFLDNCSAKPRLDMMTAIRLNELFETVSWAQFPNAENTFSPPHEFHSNLKRNTRLEPYEVHAALENAKNLAEEIHFSLDELSYHYPDEFIPKEYTAQSYLEYLVSDAFLKNYGENPTKKMRDLVEKEILLIQELAFADYFLTVWDIVRYARSVGILCQGRGSAANSVVCFLLEITAVDPNVSDVLFERFISRERGEPPDIDVDFEHERREEVIQYIYEKYGRHRAAMVANQITFQTKGALRAVGKALGVKEDSLTAGLKVSLGDRIAASQELHLIVENLVEAAGPEVRQRFPLEKTKIWAELAFSLLGRPRHLGVHSGGFIISQHPLNELVPHEPATMVGRTVVQWNKDDLEGLGFFKIDILALGMLTAIRKTLFYLKAADLKIPGTRLEVSLTSLPPECPKTYDMICETKTTGTFQIESRAQMAIIPKVMPRTFYDLVVQIGLVRPGPIVGGMARMYTRRRLGLEAVDFPDERLRPILERTMGVPVFQEQVMRIAIELGDFSAGEADELRRAMGAWKLTGQINKFEEKLRSGMLKNGVPESFANSVYKFIEGFSQYGFPESHAASFAHIAYASAYLKAHYPAPFLCGLLNSQPLGFYSEHSLLQEAQHEGVIVDAPCVLRSDWDAQLLEKGRIRIGLRKLRGLCEARVQSFLKRRTALLSWSSQQTHHLNEEELQTYVPLDALVEILTDELTPPEAMTLILSGSFRSYTKLRRDILWRLLARPSTWLADVDFTTFGEKSDVPEAWDNLRDDFTTMDTSLEGHPIELLRNHEWPYLLGKEKVVLAKNLNFMGNRAEVTVFGMMMLKQSPPTAKGFVFITIEDETGAINLIFHPDIYRKFREHVVGSGFLCVRGSLQKDGGQGSLKVQEVYATSRDERKDAEVVEFPKPQKEGFPITNSMFSF